MNSYRVYITISLSPLIIIVIPYHHKIIMIPLKGLEHCWTHLLILQQHHLRLAYSQVQRRPSVETRVPDTVPVAAPLAPRHAHPQWSCHGEVWGTTLWEMTHGLPNKSCVFVFGVVNFWGMHPYKKIHWLSIQRFFVAVSGTRTLFWMHSQGNRPLLWAFKWHGTHSTETRARLRPSAYVKMSRGCRLLFSEEWIHIQ